VGPPPQLHVERSLTGTDLEDLPSASDADSIEQRLGHRIPQFGLRAESRRFLPRVAEQVPVPGCGLSVRSVGVPVAFATVVHQSVSHDNVAAV
jgi:hypothetical protein